MGRSSNLKKMRKAEKVVIQKKTFPKRVFVVALLVVMFLGAVVLGVNIYKKVEVSAVLKWDKGRVLSTSQNSLKYAQVVLREAITLIPEDILSDYGNGYSGQDTIKSWMEKIIEVKLPQQVALIDKAKELALKGEPIELEWMPDRHPMPMTIPEVFQKMIEERQRLHISYIQEIQPDIIFAEALNEGRVTSSKLIQSLKDVRKVAGVVLSDADARLENQKRMKDFWWRAFLDKEKPKLFGIEDVDMVSLGQYNISVAEMIRSEPLSALSSEFQYYWREQIVLANIILALRKEGAHKAALVFGEAHIDTFPHLCELWGIKLKIAGRP